MTESSLSRWPAAATSGGMTPAMPLRRDSSVVVRLRILGTSDDYIEGVRLARSVKLALNHRVVLDRHATPAGEDTEGTSVPSIGALVATVQDAALPALLEFLVTWVGEEGPEGQQVAASLGQPGEQTEMRVSKATTLNEVRAFVRTTGKV